MTPTARPQPERRFIFDSHATALRGELIRPRKEKVNSSNTLTIPIAGGEDRASFNRLAVEGVITIDSAENYVSGRLNPAGTAWESKVIATVRGLNILNRVKADLLETAISSSIPVDGGERTWSIGGSRIEGLTIDGAPVDTDLDDKPFRDVLFSKMDRDVDTDDKLHARFSDEDPYLRGRKKRSKLLGHLLKPKPKADEFEALPGGCIRIKDFGCIWLAELFTSAEMWRLTMMRVKLGSPPTGSVRIADESRDEGEFDIGDGGSNGHGYPP